MRQPDIAPTKKDKLSFGKLLRPKHFMPKNFTEIASFESFFEDNMVHLEHTKHWFNVYILVITKPMDYKILGLLTEDKPNI